ncbi:hypothetical protein SLEP1_g53040 [Rubroshorea leprosula]|uniref:Uncharacterized protein n=1 Tax=Rubroshorea leprosula TaxID=152421 RepID=A0AAV5M8Z8_9ROSI|nr:hypothetical protein SLEP1_g53040 [Rubroshorea leprosula]
MKKLLESINAGTEFLDLSLLDTIKHCPPLLHQFNEGLTSIGQGHTDIDDTFCILFDLPVIVPGPFVSDHFTQTVNMGGELATK